VNPKVIYSLFKYWCCGTNKQRENRLTEENIPLGEKVLLTMHNLCVIRPEVAKTANEVAQLLQNAKDYVLNTLNKHEVEGYVKSYIDKSGSKRFYLSGVGMIKVCSIFT
jgi:hypothetical protein